VKLILVKSFRVPSGAFVLKIVIGVLLPVERLLVLHAGQDKRSCIRIQVFLRSSRDRYSVLNDAALIGGFVGYASLAVKDDVRRGGLRYRHGMRLEVLLDRIALPEIVVEGKGISGRRQCAVRSVASRNILT
jgi:hypothetical protein